MDAESSERLIRLDVWGTFQGVPFGRWDGEEPTPGISLSTWFSRLVLLDGRRPTGFHILRGRKLLKLNCRRRLSDLRSLRIDTRTKAGSCLSLASQPRFTSYPSEPSTYLFAYVCDLESEDQSSQQPCHVGARVYIHIPK